MQQARDLRVREAESALKSSCISTFFQDNNFQLNFESELARNFSTLQSHHSETVSSHNAADHASQILSLDTQKFRIAKTASDLEIEGERLEQELEGLKGKLQELEMQGVEGGEGERGKRELEDETL